MEPTGREAEPESTNDHALSRPRLIALIGCSIAIPAIALALILRAHDSGSATTGAPTASSVPTPRRARIGSLAPDVSGRDLNGNAVSLTALRGQPVVLTFFASWCHPCEQELPALEQLQRANAGRLHALGVNYQDIDDDSRAFLKRLGITFPAIAEDTGSNPIATRYDVHEMPDTVFIDANGIVRGREWGPMSAAELRAAVDRLVATPPSGSSAPPTTVPQPPK